MIDYAHRIHLLCLTLFFTLFLCLTSASAQLLKEKDKQVHFYAGTVFGGLAYGYIFEKTGSKPKAFLGAITAACIVGVLKETRDSRQYGNRFDERDLLATSYGGLSIGITLDVFLPKGKNDKRLIQF